MHRGSVRVGFWNTWLLAPRLWSDGPRLPGGEKAFFAPQVEDRAPLVGAAVAGRFDVMALGECFEESEQRAVADAWPEAELVTGTQRRGFRTGSGLATLVDSTRFPVVGAVRHRYRAGGDLRDSDTFAIKGALLTRVSLGEGLPDLEVFSTHLFAGGDLLPVPGAADSVRHHGVRMAQVDELVAFVQREHDPGAVLLVLGDFNVQAHNARLADPGADLADLNRRLAPLQVTDLWSEHGVGPGHTCTFGSADDLPPDPDEPDAVADDPDQPDAAGPSSRVERIDYLFLAAPDGVIVDVERPRRWAFPDRPARGGRAGSLSDHLALTATLHVSAHRPSH